MTQRPLLLAPDAALAAIAKISSDAIVCVDESQRIVFFNQGAEAVFGWTAEDVIGQPLDVLLPESARAAHRSHVDRFAGGTDSARPMGTRAPIRGVRRNGEEFPAEASIAKVRHAGELVLAVALRDNSERARNEREQQLLARAGVVLSSSLDVDETSRQAARLALLVGAAWSAVYLAREEKGSLARVACEHVRIEGLASLRALPESLPGGLADLGLGAGGTARLVDELPPALRPPRGGGPALSGDRSLILAPLLARDTILGALVLGAAEGASFDGNAVFSAQELAGRAAVAIDNARLYEAARRAVLGRDEIMSIVSHDVGTAISAILVSGKALERLLHGSPTSALAGNIRDAARQVERLVSDLLDAERLERGALSVRVEPIPVADVVRRAREIVEPAGAGRGVAVSLDVADDVPALLADADRVVQILCNVMGNAVKYSPDGADVRVAVSSHDGEVRFRVVDRGPGVEAEDLPRLFEPFWRRRDDPVGGAGLGLAIARGLARAHGGDIVVASEPGSGTEVTVSLPMA